MLVRSHLELASPRATQRAPICLDRLKVAAREHVFHEGDDADWLYEVTSGAVILYRTTFDGSRVIQGVRFPGEIFGYSREGGHGTSALAVQPCLLNRLARPTGVNMDEPGLARRFMAACASEFERLSDQIMILSSRSAVGGLAATLLDFSERGAAGGDLMVLPLRRTELADLLGLTMETASRAMTRLRTLGAIELLRPDVVRIRDRALLRQIAEGDGEGSARGRSA